MKKRVLIVLLVVALVFNFIFCSYVHADPGETTINNDRYGGNDVLDSNTVMEITEGGKTSQRWTKLINKIGKFNCCNCFADVCDDNKCCTSNDSKYIINICSKSFCPR